MHISDKINQHLRESILFITRNENASETTSSHRNLILSISLEFYSIFLLKL